MAGYSLFTTAFQDRYSILSVFLAQGFGSFWKGRRASHISAFWQTGFISSWA
jgi:hypothetical protein